MGTYQIWTGRRIAVDLVVALYDGIIRFLYAACEAVERGDTDGRRAASERALDIILHLQSRLHMDMGGAPVQALSEFYAATFAQIVQASQSASAQKFQHAIGCVRYVRDAWCQVAADSSVNSISSGAAIPSPSLPLNATGESFDGHRGGAGWTA